MNRKNFTILLIILMIVSLGITFLGIKLFSLTYNQPQSQSVSLRPVQSTISADGAIRSENESTLNFQIGGKLVYLPFREGDTVMQGQTIAQLDTYTLQRQLTEALNSYKITRNSFDQTNDNLNNGILQGQQKFSVNYLNANPVSGDLQYSVVSDIVKRVLDQNQANLNDSVISVELANYALQLATLSSPISGVITHEDVTVPNVNITPLTSFSISDPSHPIFRANVSESDIDFINVGSKAVIKINGLKDQEFQAVVSKIYPKKMTLSSGESVYQVDLQADSLKNKVKLEQSGTALITNNQENGVILVPAWAVLSHSYIWVEEDGKFLLKPITTGKIHGQNIEILSGLADGDRIIINPESVAAKKYQLL